MALEIILSSLGVSDLDATVTFAKNGKEALDAIISDVKSNQKRICSFDLILMDCNMPIMDGYESTSKIRQYLYSVSLP